MQQQFAARGAPLAGVAFCAAPIAVPIEMVKEGWRERPRLGAMNVSWAPPWGRSRHACQSPCRCHFRGLLVRKIRVLCALPFLDVPRSC